MRLLLDEHFSPAVAAALRDRGHDVVGVTEAGLGGQDDRHVLSWAAVERRAVVTSNIKDFRPLHAESLTAGTGHHGIVLVPTDTYSLRRDRLGPTIAALDRLLAGAAVEDALCDREHFLQAAAVVDGEVRPERRGRSRRR